jgi:hypothetical protein
MRLTPYFAIFFFLCQSIYAQPPKSTILEGNANLGYPKWPTRFYQFESVGIQDGKLIIERKTTDVLSIQPVNTSKSTNVFLSIEKKESLENKDSKNINKIVEVFPDENEKIPTDNNQDIFKELFLSIKIRAERQQVRISELQKELDRCNAIIDLSASQDKELIELLLSNLELLKKIESISSELEQLRKRNKYLETILEDYEAGDDGDLLLNLTELITNLKEALSALKIKNKEQ